MSSWVFYEIPSLGFSSDPEVMRFHCWDFLRRSLCWNLELLNHGFTLWSSQWNFHNHRVTQLSIKPMYQLGTRLVCKQLIIQNLDSRSIWRTSRGGKHFLQTRTRRPKSPCLFHAWWRIALVIWRAFIMNHQERSAIDNHVLLRNTKFVLWTSQYAASLRGLF